MTTKIHVKVDEHYSKIHNRIWCIRPTAWKNPNLWNIVALIKATFNVPALFILSYYIALSKMTTSMVMS